MSGTGDLANAEHRAEVGGVTGVVRRRCPKPGKTAVEMFRPALAMGDISGMLWIACTNPAQSMPDQARRARGRCSRAAELVVLQEAYARHRDGARSPTCLSAGDRPWGEKDGTRWTNCERPDFARAIGCRRGRARRRDVGDRASTSPAAGERLQPSFTWRVPPDALPLHDSRRESSASMSRRPARRDLDITGLHSYAGARSRGPAAMASFRPARTEDATALRGRRVRDGGRPRPFRRRALRCPSPKAGRPHPFSPQHQVVCAIGGTARRRQTGIRRAALPGRGAEPRLLARMAPDLQRAVELPP